MIAQVAECLEYRSSKSKASLESVALSLGERALSEFEIESVEPSYLWECQLAKVEALA